MTYKGFFMGKNSMGETIGETLNILFMYKTE
jgi:hypothetical protein